MLLIVAVQRSTDIAIRICNSLEIFQNIGQFKRMELWTLVWMESRLLKFKVGIMRNNVPCRLCNHKNLWSAILVLVSVKVANLVNHKKKHTKLFSTLQYCLFCKYLFEAICSLNFGPMSPFFRCMIRSSIDLDMPVGSNAAFVFTFSQFSDAQLIPWFCSPCLLFCLFVYMFVCLHL